MADVIEFPENMNTSVLRMQHDMEQKLTALENRFSFKGKQKFIDANRDRWNLEGSALRELREHHGVSGYQVAKALGVSVPRIKRLEAGLPVRDAMLLQRAYLLFLKSRYGLQSQKVTLPEFDPNSVEEYVHSRKMVTVQADKLLGMLVGEPREILSELLLGVAEGDKRLQQVAFAQGWMQASR